MDGSRRIKVLLFAAASLISLLSGALAGALTRQPPPARTEPALSDPAAPRSDCLGAGCGTARPSLSVAPTVDAPCDEPDEMADVACTSLFAGDDEDDDDSSGPGGGGNSGPG